MAKIWLRNPALSGVTAGDEIDLDENNRPELPEKFGFPDLTNTTEVQAACKAWYPTKLRGEDLAGYEITPVDVTDREGVAGDIVFAPVGRHPPGDRFKPSTRRRVR
jgi:hypothetical protein